MEQTPTNGCSWGNICQALKETQGHGRTGQQSSGNVKKEMVWQIRETGGQEQALLYSHDPASPAGPPDSRSRRRRTPGQTGPAPTIPAASPSAPLLAMGKSHRQGPIGQAPLRARSRRRSLDFPGSLRGGIFGPRAQRKETDPTGASTHVTPAPFGPSSLPTSLPHSPTCRSAPRGQKSPPGCPTPWCGRALRSEERHAKVARCRGCGHPAPPRPTQRGGHGHGPEPPRARGRAPWGRPGPPASLRVRVLGSRVGLGCVPPTVTQSLSTLSPKRLPRPLSNLRLPLAARTSAPSRGDARARHSTLETQRIRVGSPLRREAPRRRKRSPDSPRRECREAGVWPGGNRNLASSEWHALYP